MFASKTPRDLNHDPKPYVGASGDRDYEQSAPWHAAREYDPRPEFDHVQHNEPNPILVEFRRTLTQVEVPAPWLAGHWTQTDEMWDEMVLLDGSMDDEHIGTLAQEDHARKVLSRLAALQEAS